MISLMLSLFLLLAACIIVNSTTSISRRPSLFDLLRKRNRVPLKTNQFDRFLQARVQARAHQFLTPEEHGFDMPTFLKYGSMGRPPGKFHLRHSLKEFTFFPEFPHPSFEIFFIKKITNNNNNNNYIDNGGSGTDGTDGGTNDIAVPVPVGNDSDVVNTNNVVGHRSNQIDTWLTDRIKSIHFWYMFNKYKFNIDGISTTTTTTTATPATATATINYKTSAEGIADVTPGLSDWFTDRIEANQCNSISNNNSNTGSISTTNTTTSTTPNNFHISLATADKDNANGNLPNSIQFTNSLSIESTESLSVE